MSVVPKLFYRLPVGSSYAGRTYGGTLYFVCDLESELPSADVIDGDSAYTADSGKRWNRTGGAWVLRTTDNLASALQDSNGTILPIDVLTDGQYLKRDGSSIVSAVPTAAAAWGNITGTLSAQTDLQTALDGKLATGGTAAAVTGLSVTAGKTLTVLKTLSLTAADDTGVYTLPTGTKTLLATDGSAAALTSFPTLNQSTTGSAATLTTARAIYGNDFNGSAALTQVIASTYGGTGNGFTKISGPTTAERTKTMRDASDTVLELGGSYTPTGTWTSLTLVTPALGTPASGALTNCTFPTLNQNTTGSAASLSISGQTGLVTLTGLASTNRIKTVRDAADTILELGGSYTPTGTWTSLTMVTPVLGTPTSGTLTNCTALPVAGITPSTSTALGVGSIELGHATDTTIARVSAGVVSIEGVNVLTDTSTTNHVTNKGIDPRVVTSATNNTTPTPSADTTDLYIATSMTVNMTFGAPTGSPVAGQRLLIRILDDGTSRTLAWNSGTGGYNASTDLALPTATTLSKTLYCLFVYNATGTAKWNLLAKLDNI